MTPNPTANAPRVPLSGGPVVRWSLSSLWRLGLPLLLFVIVWMDLVRQLSYTWETNEQYAYGWFVPFLALGLLFRKWTSRPAPQPQELSFWPALLLILFAICFLPLRVIHEVNPDWPLISWAITSGLVAVSLSAVCLAGGAGWVRHFAFPICFMLVSVRWPYRIEYPLTQGLMQVVASLTVEILGWFNIPAFQRGNLIELSTGVLGVNEACSGVRSFQSSLMGALFLGELYLLRWPIRLLLVGAGLTVAFLFNVCRTLILTWQANAHGLSAIDKWHDPAGLTIAVVSFAILWLLAVVLKGKWSARAQGSVVNNPVVDRPAVLPLRRYYIYGLTGWVVFVLVGNELWFRFHESRAPAAAEWSVRLPTEVLGFREIQLSDRENSMLKQDISRTGIWEETAGKHWTVYYLRWLPGSMLSRIEARGHRPEVCMRAGGFRLEEDFGSTVFDVSGIGFSFHRYAFEYEGGKVHVFFCLWEDGAENLPRTETLTYKDRLHAALRAQRRVGQRSVEIILRGYPSLEEAESAVRSRLPDLIQIEQARLAATIPGGR